MFAVSPEPYDLVHLHTHPYHLAKSWFLHGRAGSDPVIAVLYFGSQRDWIQWQDQRAAQSSQEDKG
jgi:hypothetical protein